MSAAPGSRNSAGETPTEHAHRWATELAISMAKRFYPEVTQWKPLPDLLGVITQIDNMTTGLMRSKGCGRITGLNGEACGLQPPCPDCGLALHDVGAES